MSNPYPPPPPWARDIASVGITGTKGKSSTTRFVWAGLSADAGGPVARVSTLDTALGEELGPPPADHEAFLGLMARLHQAGGRRAAIEATSATLGLGFARAWPFRVGVFTNLGHDHLRTHGSFEHYLASKAQLFVALPAGGVAVLNADDPNSSLIAEVLPAGVRTLWFAGPRVSAQPGPSAPAQRPVDLRVLDARPSWSGLALELAGSGELAGVPERLQLRVLPIFQAANVAAALLACVALGVPAARAAAAIAGCEAPRGRFELIRGAEGEPQVVIDYAHTPEALRAALVSARALAPRRILLVVGAGGDTDPGKRGPMGAAAGLADLVWLTSDNPRSEDPREIAADLQAGLGDREAHIELDRGRAVAAALAEAGEQDLVILAGKGHEEVQEIGGERLAMSDHELVAAGLAARKG